MLPGRRIRRLRRFVEMVELDFLGEWSRHGTSGIHGHLNSLVV
jgi:hypothetical protein